MPEITLRGAPLSPGIALGKACFYWQAARHPDTVVGSTRDQAARLQNALAWMDRRLEALAKKAEARLDQRHGVMFEVPSACLQAKPLLEMADFGCMGTNDLVQYLFATDRANDHHNTLFDHPALWSLLEALSKAAKATGKPLSICGALASNPHFTRRIIKVGIKMISTYSERISTVRRAVLLSRNILEEFTGSRGTPDQPSL